MKQIAIFLAIFILPFSMVRADEDDSAAERIEVTGSRISYRDLLETPAISITKQGDYLLQSITLTNDTRDKEARKKEIYATIEKLLQRSGKRYQILNDDAYRTVLDQKNFQVELQEEGKRPDVSKAKLQIRVETIGDSSQGEQAIRALRDFARQSPKIGRTEIDLEAETALGMNKPERYRYELIEAIAEDSKKIAADFGADCKVSLEGLNSRIEWKRFGATELLLYVPYSMNVSECSAGKR